MLYAAWSQAAHVVETPSNAYWRDQFVWHYKEFLKSYLYEAHASEEKLLEEYATLDNIKLWNVYQSNQQLNSFEQNLDELLEAFKGRAEEAGEYDDQCDGFLQKLKSKAMDYLVGQHDLYRGKFVDVYNGSRDGEMSVEGARVFSEKRHLLRLDENITLLRTLMLLVGVEKMGFAFPADLTSHLEKDETHAHAKKTLMQLKDGDVDIISVAKGRLSAFYGFASGLLELNPQDGQPPEFDVELSSWQKKLQQFSPDI